MGVAWLWPALVAGACLFWLVAIIAWLTSWDRDVDPVECRCGNPVLDGVRCRLCYRPHASRMHHPAYGRHIR